MVHGLMASGGIKKEQILFTTKHAESAAKVESELQIKKASSNAALVEQCQAIVLAVKPQNIAEVLSEIKDSAGAGKTFLSIVASVTTSQIESLLPKNTAVLRAMPNTPAFVGEGISALCLGKKASEKDFQRAETILRTLGKVVQVDERLMDAVTGLSGCGPAYIYVVLESLTDAGIKVGLPRDLAKQLSAQTVLGAAKMLLETGRHPAALKDEVTTPAGCTIDGLLELEEGKIRVTFIKAVVQATKRAKALAKQAKIG